MLQPHGTSLNEALAGHVAGDWNKPYSHGKGQAPYCGEQKAQLKSQNLSLV